MTSGLGATGRELEEANEKRLSSLLRVWVWEDLPPRGLWSPEWRPVRAAWPPTGGAFLLAPDDPQGGHRLGAGWKYRPQARPCRL